MIAIVDTGGANIGSIENALERIGQRGKLTSDTREISEASHVILPGVGAAADSMGRLRALNLVDCVKSLKQPTLGICLGMQMFFESSQEGDTRCLGLLPGTVRRIPPARGLPVPHMGWNQVVSKNGGALMDGIPSGSYFYFVHSFVAPEGPWVSGYCDYGGPLPAVVSRGNYHGVQFHPERSSLAGSRLLQNFLNL